MRRIFGATPNGCGLAALRDPWLPVNDQTREIPRQRRLPTDGHDLNVGEAKMIPQSGFEAELLVTSLDDEQLGFLDLDAHPRTSKCTSRTASIASSS